MCKCLKLQQVGLLVDLMNNPTTSESDRGAIEALIAEITMKRCDEFSVKISTKETSGQQISNCL